MPKRPNIKKGAAALFQNGKAITAFEDDEKNGGVCGAVIRMLGRSGFQVHCDGALVVQATPRGLFTKGTMRFSVGDLVILQGTERVLLDARPRFWEIVARVEPAEAAKLARLGKISKEVMAAAAAALSAARGEPSEEEKAKQDLQNGDFFLAEENPEGEDATANPRASLKQQRAARETAASIQARVATLKGSGGKRLDGGVSAGELTDPLAGLNEEFARWRASGGAKKKVAMSVGGSTTVQTEEDLIVEAADERLRAEDAASEAAFVSSLNAAAHAAEIKAFLESRQVPENWDEVNLDDL